MANPVGIKRLLEDYQDPRVFKKICYCHQDPTEEVEDEEQEKCMFADPNEYELEEEEPEEYQEPEEIMEEEEETLFADPEEETEKSDQELEEYEPQEEYAEDLEEKYEKETELEEEYEEDQVPEELTEEEDIEIPAKSTRLERDIFDDYALMKDLGRGAFGAVKLCRHKVSGQLFACKIMSKEDFYHVHFFTEEVDILRHLSPYPGVVGFKDVYEDNDWMYLVMELYPHGDLLKFMQKGINLPSETELAIKFKGLIETLCYCHEKGVVHRDIKPDNILLTESNSFVLADFGQGTRISDGQSVWGVFGTKDYVAPKMLTDTYSEKVDVWSVGILLCYLLTDKVPFRGYNDAQIYKAIVEQEISFDDKVWRNVSSEAKDLISVMLIKDPKKRPGAKEVLRHPWFSTVLPTLERENTIKLLKAY